MRDWDSTASAYKVDLDRELDETDEEYQARVFIAEEVMREAELRLRAMASVFEKADRILSGLDIAINLKPVTTDGPVAWSDGLNITLNSDKLGDYSDESLQSLYGVNYHELCHILYTPRAGSEIVKWVIENNYQREFNFLEDQRIETLFVGRYPSSRKFVEAAVLRYAIQVSDKWNLADWHLHQAFPLIHGRKFLDKELRDHVKEQYATVKGAESAETIAKIIDTYRMLAFPKDTQTAKVLIKAFAESNALQGNAFSGSCAYREAMVKGRAVKPSDQGVDLQKSNVLEAKDSINDKSGDDSGEQAPSQPQSTEAGDYVNNHEKSVELGKDVRDLINSALNELTNDREVKGELNAFRKAVAKSDSLRLKTRVTNYEPAKPSTSDITAARTFSDVLKELEAEAEAAWELETPSGKLNMTRAMHAGVNDLPRMFDRWYEGSDAVDIEAAILLDHSGSMGGRIDAATRSLWSIKRALESIESSVTAYSFNHVSRVLYAPNERAEPNEIKYIPAEGNTNPVKALEETELIMSASQRKTKLLFIITDGMWDGEKTANECIARMKQDGVLTVLVFIGNLRELEFMSKERKLEEMRRYTHGADIYRVISEPRDLVRVAQDVVATHLKGKISR
jgi:hypothetical protein